MCNLCYEKASWLVRTRAIQKTFIRRGPSRTLMGMRIVTLTLVVTLTGSKHCPSRWEGAVGSAIYDILLRKMCVMQTWKMPV